MRGLKGIAYLFFLLIFSSICNFISVSAYSSYSGVNEALLITGVICAVYIAIFVIWIIVAIWVYKDAKKRGENPVLWLLIVLVAGLIGLIIWFVIRPPIGGKKTESVSDRRCPNCGRIIPMDASLCPYCGKRFEIFIK